MANEIEEQRDMWLSRVSAMSMGAENIDEILEEANKIYETTCNKSTQS